MRTRVFPTARKTLAVVGQAVIGDNLVAATGGRGSSGASEHDGEIPVSSDDQRNVLTVVLASIGRETSVAEVYYARGRALLTSVATLFVAAQAAFIALLGRTSAGSKVELLVRHKRSPSSGSPLLRA